MHRFRPGGKNRSVQLKVYNPCNTGTYTRACAGDVLFYTPAIAALPRFAVLEVDWSLQALLRGNFHGLKRYHLLPLCVNFRSRSVAMLPQIDFDGK